MHNAIQVFILAIISQFLLGTEASTADDRGYGELVDSKRSRSSTPPVPVVCCSCPAWALLLPYSVTHSSERSAATVAPRCAYFLLRREPLATSVTVSTVFHRRRNAISSQPVRSRPRCGRQLNDAYDDESEISVPHRYYSLFIVPPPTVRDHH